MEALNAGDVDAALSYLADDAQITSDQAYTGKEEIRGWYEGLVGANGVSTLSDCQVDGETVTCSSVYTDDGLQAMGVDFLEGALVLVVRDGEIQSYTFTPSPESLAKLPPPPATLAETGGGSLPAMLVGPVAWRWRPVGRQPGSETQATVWRLAIVDRWAEDVGGLGMQTSDPHAERSMMVTDVSAIWPICSACGGLARTEMAWRASLENAHTGARQGFASLDALVAFLEEKTDQCLTDASEQE